MLVEVVAVILGGVLINNFIFMRYLGLCPFIGVSRQLETALGMSGAVIFVMTFASTVTAAFEQFILVPLGLEYLRTIAYILVIAAFVQLVEIFMKKTAPGLYRALGIYLPLITTNCAVLGVAMLNVRNSYGILMSTLNGLAGALGWSLAIIIFAGIRERWKLMDIPPVLEGFPLALVSTGLMSLAFLGFSGLFRNLVK
ncbi:MAG: electron transport complex subunit RsxA [Candidatus Fermentithermobacillus carboniphilus]|uniref:Ion-translocating oxidoreductase complex subunit A n=1 Tax=Candidatus Fermentithermobacillus carboniphilus TaxID=3085328 RepID=A0AAT9LF35_9FIRM|nr:MAG: electron transport complex subunit RsxA [Candidatus Fermentithermobacillus carboniphilus]